MRLFFSCAFLFILTLCSFSLFAKPVTLYTLDGQAISFTQLRNKWVFINYWASWCDACTEEIHELNKFYRKNRDRVALFAVNYEDLPIQEQEKLIKQFNLTYPSLKKDPGESLALGDIEALPVTFIYNPQGQLCDKIYGAITARRLTRYLVGAGTTVDIA